MKYLIILLSLLLFACSYFVAPSQDYLGKPISGERYHYWINEATQDPINSDIYLIQYGVLVHNIPKNFDVMKYEIGFTNMIKQFMDENEYSYYYLMKKMSAHRIAKIHFFKTEEEFDKWNKRYKP